MKPITAITSPITTISSDIANSDSICLYKLPNCHARNPKINALTNVPKKVIVMYFLISNLINPQNALITTLGTIGRALVVKIDNSIRLFLEYFSSVFSISFQDNPRYLPHRSTKGLPTR